MNSDTPLTQQAARDRCDKLKGRQHAQLRGGGYFLTAAEIGERFKLVRSTRYGIKLEKPTHGMIEAAVIPQWPGVIVQSVPR